MGFAGQEYWSGVPSPSPTETLLVDFQFSLACIGEGNGYPLQCSCLENPRNGGAWWAAIYGVAQSRTRLKRLSSNAYNNPIGLLLELGNEFKFVLKNEQIKIVNKIL